MSPLARRRPSVPAASAPAPSAADALIGQIMSATAGRHAPRRPRRRRLDDHASSCMITFQALEASWRA